MALLVGISNTSESAGPRCTTAPPAAPKQNLHAPKSPLSTHKTTVNCQSATAPSSHITVNQRRLFTRTRPTKQKLCINSPTAYRYRRTRPQTMRSPTGAIRAVELVRDMQDPTASSILHVSTHQPKGADASFSPVPWTFSPSSFL